MIAQLFAALVRLFGPEVDDANAAAAAELPERVECDAPFMHQPYDCPDRVRWALTAISDRECPGNYCGKRRWVGRHRRDSGHDPGLWRMGHRRGAKGYRTGGLHWWCPAHADPEGMSTVGPHGLIYAYNVHRLRVPGNCVPWWVFAAPAVSAKAARARYLKMCDVEGRSAWCPSASAAYRAYRRRCRRRELPRAECGEALTG